METKRECEKRILVLAPTIKDASIASMVLQGAGLKATTCRDIGDLCTEILSGAGAVVLTDESIRAKEPLTSLCVAIGRQPAWSDLPVVLLSTGGADSPIAAGALHALRNVLVLERPAHLPTLVSAVKTALRSRERQYEIRDLLLDRERSIEFLRLIGDAESTRDIARAAIEFFAKLSGCEAVAIRLRDRDDYPYFEYRGFTQDFIVKENYLCAHDAGGNLICDSRGQPVLECMCGNIIGGRFNPAQPFFSYGGSFWTNSTTNLLATTTDTDRLTHTRNYCNVVGYESLALIPLRVGAERLGVLHFADRRRNMFGTEAISHWERLADSLAVALARSLAEEALQASEHRFREVLENSLDAAYRRDFKTGKYDYVSPVVRQVFDIEPDVLKNMSLQDLMERIHSDDHEAVTRAIEEGLASGSGRMEYRFRGDDGQYRWVADHFTVQKDRDGNPVSRGGIVREISELRKAQEALKQEDRRKDEFLAMLGHELRNPLAAITTGLRLLKSRNAEQHAWVKESLERQTRQLVALVDDLLDISRIKQGKIQLHLGIVDLRSIAEHAVESTADLMAERRHAFSIYRPEMPLHVLGDPTRLQQIIVNLLNNAAKYTNDGGRIELVLSRTQDEAVVRVKDNGMGIPADMQDAIFDLFGQVNSVIHRPQQGLGIGLSLVKLLAEQHRGKVAIHSEGIGKGSEFTVVLPVVEAAEDLESKEVGGASIDEEPMDILLVEDNREAARMLAAMFQEKGHTLRLAEKGSDAIDSAARRQPDVVILDIGLPDMSGYEVAEKLREGLGYHQTLIIAVTGYGQEKDRQRSRQAGIDHHLVKPVEYETIALLARDWRRTIRDHHPASFPKSQKIIGSGAVRPARILIIDDTRAIALITQRVLQERGHQVEVAFDAKTGVEKAKWHKPELVLCDINLPGASGFEVLQSLRSNPDLKDIVIAAMTGYDEDEEKERTKKAGFNAHLVKPVTLEQIEDLINRSLRRNLSGFSY